MYFVFLVLSKILTAYLTLQNMGVLYIIYIIYVTFITNKMHKNMFSRLVFSLNIALFNKQKNESVVSCCKSLRERFFYHNYYENKNNKQKTVKRVKSLSI